MMRTNGTRAADYLKSRLLRLLLLAVILTSGFSVNYVAEAKYATYLSDQSSAVADDLCFSSNYLGEEDSDTEYIIGSWNGKSYEFTLEIRNFENSLRYNKSSEGLYYYVTAEVYQEDDEGKLVHNGAFSSVITYDQNATVCRYEITDGEKVDCAYLPGMDDFVHDSGTQTVTVKVAADNPVTQRQYLVVQAHTIPTSQVSQVTKTDGTLPMTSTPGVFEVMLESTFVLNMGSTEVEISHNLTQSSTDYTVICKLICGNISGGTMGLIQIYYNSEELDPDVNLGEVHTDADGSYVTVTMYSESIKNCYFFKKAMGITVEDNRDIIVRLQEGEQVEEAPAGGTYNDQNN